MVSVCVDGSSSGTPAWCRSKWSDEGVMMPYVSCRGVRLEASSSGTFVSRLKNRVAFSNRERDPYGLTGAPSTRGSDDGPIDRDRQATRAALQAAPSRRNQRRDWRRDEWSGCMLPYDTCPRYITYLNQSDGRPR